MKRHPALIPLSHDHHHGLVQARRLHRAADGAAAERHEAVTAFLAFFHTDTRQHFREEEEHLFPLLVGVDDPATELLARALLEHQQLHALAHALESELADGDPSATAMRELGSSLEQHIRYEERTLFPFIQDVVSEEELHVDVPEEPPARGSLWGAETEDLNATLLAWPAGAGPPEHVNSERDVLLVVLSGTASVVVDGEERPLATGETTIIEKRSTRQITAGPEGVRYLSVHVRRPPIQIAPGRR